MNVQPPRSCSWNTRWGVGGGDTAWIMNAVDNVALRSSTCRVAGQLHCGRHVALCDASELHGSLMHAA